MTRPAKLSGPPRIPRARPAHPRRRPFTAVALAPVESAAAPATPLAKVRPTIVERCAELDVRLTDRRRQMVDLLDRVPSPIVLEDAWWLARELDIDINRSSLHRLVGNLVDAGVLVEWGPGDRRTRYTTPVAVQVEIEGADGAAQKVEDQTLAEMLVEALGKRGVNIGARKIVVTLKD